MTYCFFILVVLGLLAGKLWVVLVSWFLELGLRKVRNLLTSPRPYHNYLFLSFLPLKLFGSLEGKKILY